MTVVFVSSLGSTHTSLAMNQEERHALLSNVQMANWAYSFGVCGEISSSLNLLSENVLPAAKDQKEASAKSISDQHSHGKLLNIMQHVKRHMET